MARRPLALSAKCQKSRPMRKLVLPCDVCNPGDLEELRLTAKELGFSESKSARVGRCLDCYLEGMRR
jgi:hypothetical protein